ncbi:hypothetical protein BDK51DRAFT_17978 [Blyttiomyces helicus]|uniref:Uncharacterized protein n=1 Tax=Blyttiomyces helicus TaxID=388810 RepID=A0A4P9W8Y7_9FUNG|nr:hypothetical protein BDK51DRAFT_17978 [Blyttiomyces helicus]|eukprot:RKO87933.1 hypothetical protein BDK51DRAFT_17978 [Blyttiomyces helicus]
MVFIEAPNVAQQTIKIPQLVLDQCAADGLPFSGNAAGKNGTDLAGAPDGPNLPPTTFTAKGIVALIFTIIAALLGMATVVWFAQEQLPPAVKAEPKM